MAPFCIVGPSGYILWAGPADHPQALRVLPARDSALIAEQRFLKLGGLGINGYGPCHRRDLPRPHRSRDRVPSGARARNELRCATSLARPWLPASLRGSDRLGKQPLAATDPRPGLHYGSGSFLGDRCTGETGRDVSPALRPGFHMFLTLPVIQNNWRPFRAFNFRVNWIGHGCFCPDVLRWQAPCPPCCRTAIAISCHMARRSEARALSAANGPLRYTIPVLRLPLRVRQIL